MRRIILLGANGQVGQALLKRQVYFDCKIISFTRNELDITSLEQIKLAILRVQPDLVINAAAFTAVDGAETNSSKAFDVNAFAVEKLAIVCKKFNIPFFHISTDYVFDGKKLEPYQEIDEEKPLNVYGHSKLLGENLLKENFEKHLILRTSWVFSEFRTNFPKAIMKLASTREELRVINDQYGGPTSADAIADTLLKIAGKDKIKWGTYHFSGYPFTSWFGFTHKILEVASKNGYIKKMPTVVPVKSDEFKQTASRPLNSRLDNHKIERVFGIKPENWEVYLRENLNSIWEAL